MKKSLIALFALVLLWIPGAVTNAHAVTVGLSWSMVQSGGQVPEIGGTNRDMDVFGTYSNPTGGIEWDAAPSGGNVLNSSTLNPGTEEVAIGARITSDPITQGSGYSGNVIQKGLFGDSGQIKAQLVPKNDGTFNCRFKGTLANTILQAGPNADNVDDGATHWVVCYRSGNTLGVNVDGEIVTTSLNVGSISNNKNIKVGNKADNATASDQHFGRNYCSAYAYGSGAITQVTNLVSGNC